VLSSLGGSLDRLADRERLPRISLASPVVWLPVIVLCAVGLAVRLVDFYRGMWEDELTIAWYTQLGLRLVLPTVAQNGSHPPLYFFVAVLDSRYMDVLPALRAPSVAAGVLTIAVVYFLVLRLAGQAAALVAGALTTFAPIAVWYSDEARMYALVWFLVLASYLWLVWGSYSKHWRVFAVLHAITVGLALWTDYSAALALLPQPLLILLLKHRGWFLGSWIVGWLAILPWVFFLREQYGRIQAQRFPGLGADLHSWIAVLLDITGVHANYASLGDTLPFTAIVAVLVLLGAAAIATVIAAFRGHLLVAVVALCLTAGVLAVSAGLAREGVVAVIAPRVMGLIVFGLIVVFAAGAAAILSRPSRTGRTVTAALIGILLACTIAATGNLLQHGSNGTSWDHVADTIQSNAQPGDELIYYPVATKYAVDPYLSPTSRWRNVYNGIWPTDDASAEQIFATWTTGKRRVWFVYYAIGGVDMPQHDQWFMQHGLCRVMGDPTGALGLIEYQATTNTC
jgi:uncharacterized membrane protein